MMKKFELGLFSLAILVGNYLGSQFGIAVAICIFMVVSGLVDEGVKLKNQKHKEKKGGKVNA